MRVEGDLPEMSVWVGEIAVIAAPKRPGRLLQDLRAGSFGPCQYRIDLGLACDILRDTDAAIAIPNRTGQTVFELSLTAPQRQHHTAALKRLTLVSLARFDLTKPRRS